MRNEYVVDWPLLKKWTNENSYSGVLLAFFIVWCVLMVATLVLAVLALLDQVYAYALFFALLAFFCFHRAFLWNTMIAKRQYKRFVQLYKKDSWVRTIRFEEDKIIVCEEKSENILDYSDVLEIVEKEDTIHLKMPARMVIRLCKSKFIDCTWEECKNKILESNPDVKL